MKIYQDFSELRLGDEGERGEEEEEDSFQIVDLDQKVIATAVFGGTWRSAARNL